MAFKLIISDRYQKENPTRLSSDWSKIYRLPLQSVTLV